MTARKRKRVQVASEEQKLVEKVACEVQEFVEKLFWDHPAHSADDRADLEKALPSLRRLRRRSWSLFAPAELATAGRRN
jgi:hypothetical protein